MLRRSFLAACLGAGTGSLIAICPAGVAPLADASIGDIILTELERRLIQSYYRSRYEVWTIQGGNNRKHKGLPPGIAKKGTLPPGIAKQLVRNGSLPPGLAWQPLPPDLVAQLPRRPSDQQIVIVDDRVMLVRAATNLILDVLTVTAIDALND
jgi:hypothetical protein